jgi:cysteine-rich repeat protein
MRRFASFAVVLAGGCSLIVEQEIEQLPETLGGSDGGESIVCQTAQDCLDIEAEQNNCRQVCALRADGVGYCTGGAVTPDGVLCGGTSNEVCLRGTCTPRRCGDGFTDRAAGEYCDDGNTIDVDTCQNDCTRSCLPPATPQCNDVPIAVGSTVALHLDACSGGVGTCDSAGSGECMPVMALPDGTSCVIPMPPRDAGMADGGVDAGPGTMGRCQTGRCIPFFP